MKKFLKSTDKDYVDVTKATRFTLGVKPEGCITIISTSSGIRSKLDKSLLEKLGNAESVSISFLDRLMVVATAEDDDNDAYTVKKNGVIYSTPLAKKILEVAGKKVETNSSAKIGSYHMQKDDNDVIVAVISL